MLTLVPPATSTVTASTIDAIDVHDTRILRDGTEAVRLDLGLIDLEIVSPDLIAVADALRALALRIDEATLDARDEARAARQRHCADCGDTYDSADEACRCPA